MRILWIDYDSLKSPFTAGGQAYMTQELTSRLGVKGHHIDILNGNFPGAASLSSESVSRKYLGISSLGYFVSLLSHWLALPFYVLVNQSKYDLIVECFNAPFTVSFVPLISKIPILAIPTFYDSEKLSLKYHMPLHIFKSWLLGKYRHFSVFTKEIAERVQNDNPQANCAVIPGGVNQEYLKLCDSKGRYALYLGRIDIYNKGIDTLLKSWQNIEYPLVIAGTGLASDVVKMNSLIREYNLSKLVKYVGHKSGSDKLKLLQGASCVIQPSRYETFGFVALEALAAGKPLICSDIVGYNWLPKNLVAKHVVGDADSLTRCIKKVLANPGDSAPRKKFASSFDWDRIADITEKLILRSSNLYPRIAGYHLLKPLYPANVSGHFRYAIYVNDKGEQAFAKSVISHNDKFALKELRNEAYVTKLLNTLLRKNIYQVDIPQFISFNNRQNSSILITDFIQGNTFESKSISKQADVYTTCVKEFEKINLQNLNLLLKDKKLPRKSKIRYCCVSLILYFYHWLHDLANSNLYLNNLPSLIKSITQFVFSPSNLGLTHGDFVTNLIAAGNKTYLIDLQTCSITDLRYEKSSLLSCLYQQKDLYQKLSQALAEYPGSPLLDYYCGAFNYLDHTWDLSSYHKLIKDLGNI